MPAPEIYIDRQGEIGLENMGELMRAFPRFARRAAASALKSEGYRLRGIVADAIWHGGPEGEPWPKLNPHTGRLSLGRKRNKEGGQLKNHNWVWRGPKGGKKRVRSYKRYRHRESGRINPLMKFKGAVRYVYQEQDGEPSVNIGFVRASRSLLAMVHKQAEGYEIRVTPRMRRFAFALGFPLDESTSVLTVPARRLLPPILQAEENNIRRNVRQKYINSVTRYILNQQKSISGEYAPAGPFSDRS